MFSKRIIESDDFIELSKEAQSLYFHLCMYADDDGFINNTKSIIRAVGADKKDLEELKQTQYVHEFESGVVLIIHWKVHNYIQKDRYRPTSCTEEKNQVELVYGSAYEFNRSKNMLKVKQMYPVDLRVIDVLEGSGANKGKAGALLVNYKGYPLKVGSGLTKELREKFWQDKDSIIGKIVTIKYFEETTNKKDDSKSLRFPIFLEVRYDKDEESYN